MSRYIYGIDFGTTNSALAILDTSTNEVVKTFITPSLLFFPQIQTQRAITYYVGNEAIEKYVDSRMDGRFMKSIKRILRNKSFIETKISSKNYKIEELVALVLIYLKKQADDFLGEKVTTAVIGRPVVFDENPEKDTLAQERLAKAAIIAGFQTFFFQMEPIGAAFTYERQIDKEELVLVADFGGGTSDFSLMRLNPNAIHKSNRKEDMIAKGGIYIGGDNFDSDIMWHRGTPHFGRGVKEKWGKDKLLNLPLSYFSNICSWEKMNFLDTLKWKTMIRKSYLFSDKNYRVKNLLTLVENNLGYNIFKQIEKAKVALSDADIAHFSFDQDGIVFDESISIEDFSENIISRNVADISNYLLAFLTEHNTDKEAIDAVFMTGGSSMVRPLKNVFIEHFGADKIKSGDNFNSVALGLAYSYNLY